MKSSAPLELRSRMKGGREHRVPLSDRAHGCGDYTTHGLRSSFRDWAAETTAYPNHVVEQALAHAISNGVEKAICLRSIGS